MKAMILAAGLGTRLGPLTANRPKALVPVGNRPVIDKLIMYLKTYDVSEIIVNAHHHHKQLVAHLDGGRPYGIPIEVRVEPEILGTGGGIKNTEDFWGVEHPFIVINSDILTDVDLSKAYETHLKNQNWVTMVLHDYGPFNQIRIDSKHNIVHISPDNHAKHLAFTGIHILDPAVLRCIPNNEFSDIIDCYRKLIHEGKPVRAHVSKGHYWRDMGTIGSYVLANKESLREQSFLPAPGCRIHDSVNLKDWAVIGENTRVEKNAEITRSILWEDVQVKKGVTVVDSIVTDAKHVTRNLTDEIY